MPLRKAEDGRIVVVKDWTPDRIGRACLQAQPLPGEGMLWLQDLLVPARPVGYPTKPRPVKVDTSVKELVKLFGGI